MSDLSPQAHNLLAIQRDIFRLAKRDHELSPGRLAALSGLNARTIQNWAEGAAMPAFAFAILSEHIPEELTSLLFEPFDKRVTAVERDDGDLDSLGCETAGFTSDYVEAKSDGRITPIERAKLTERAGVIAARAHRVRAA
jgi:hypothetical protein